MRRMGRYKYGACISFVPLFALPLWVPLHHIPMLYRPPFFVRPVAFVSPENSVAGNPGIDSEGEVYWLGVWGTTRADKRVMV